MKVENFYTKNKDYSKPIEKFTKDLGDFTEKFTEETTYFHEKLDELTQPAEETEEGDIGTFIQESIVTAFQEHIFNEANIKDLQTLLANTIQEVLGNNPLTKMMAQGSELTEEQIKNVDQNAGAFVTNLATSINPILPELLTRGMGESWQEEAAANPQTFMLLVSKLQNSGVFNWLESLTGSIGMGGTQGTSAPSTNIRRKKSSW